MTKKKEKICISDMGDEVESIFDTLHFYSERPYYYDGGNKENPKLYKKLIKDFLKKKK